MAVAYVCLGTPLSIVCLDYIEPGSKMCFSLVSVTSCSCVTFYFCIVAASYRDLMTIP